ncbi:hypothetical protein NAT47_06720 [Flavobacterium sp. HXWNR69]|uniref:Outer membrane protein beta-barrel domain-containing protein n=1 Tax=Flavobacterium fragile TaxID=2949085 RepID=A0ABT0TGZ3_9FLAO|nr:hypothetical protein [Flavobacterium sp. HXWNR69]MCL9770103.1 hypothetical protein [Flavobacterium sp. HXWNR69]
MKKLFFTIFLVYNLSFGQNKKDTKNVDLEPSMRIGFSMPIHFGNNLLSKEFDNNFGLSSNFSFIKIYDVRLSIGLEYQRYNGSNSSIGNISHINKFNYSFQSDYTISLKNKLDLVPFINYSFARLNYKNSYNTVANQRANEIKIGTHIDYQLNKTYSIYYRLSYNKLINDMKGSPQDKKYYGNTNAIQLTLGFEFN